jgi:integrase
MTGEEQERKTKRGQNDMSFRERGGGWQCRATIGAERRSFTAPTRDEAKKKAETAKSQYLAGKRTDGGKERFEDYLAHWLADADLRPTARRGYKSYIDNHIVPALGKLRLEEITADHVQRLVHAKRGKLAPRSIRQMHAVIRKALNDALDDRLIAANEASRTRLPRVPFTEVPAMPEEDARALLAALEGDRLEALYTVALAMGLRQGEALGLWWECVDLANRRLRVVRQLQRIDGAWAFSDPKSYKSRRTIPIPAACVPVLQRHWEAQERERPTWTEPHQAPLVFRSPRGAPLHAATVTHYFQRTVLPKAKLGAMRFHDLRHACATLLIARGVHPRVVMEILGHSQIALTMNTYGHVGEVLGRSAMEEMDRVFETRLGHRLGQ